MTAARIVVILVISIGAGIYGKEIPISTQAGILATLFQAASIIFGILGAWLAIVYPQELQNLFKKDVELGEVGDLLKQIFIPLRISAGVVLFCILHSWLAPLMHLCTWFESHKILVRQVNFGITSAAVLATILALVGVFYPMNSAEAEIDGTKKALDNHLARTSSTTKRKRPKDKPSDED